MLLYDLPSPSLTKREKPWDPTWQQQVLSFTSFMAYDYYFPVVVTTYGFLNSFPVFKNESSNRIVFGKQ